METIDKRIVESTKQICRLYHNRVNIKEAVKLMRGQNISAELVKRIYNQLSADVENLMEERFHYYTVESEQYSPFYEIDYWTSRYLLIYADHANQSGLYEITILDLFNDASM
jgi:hypothetical protein